MLLFFMVIMTPIDRAQLDFLFALSFDQREFSFWFLFLFQYLDQRLNRFLLDKLFFSLI